MFCVKNKPKSTGKVREKRKKAPKRRHVCVGKIERVGNCDTVFSLIVPLSLLVRPL